MVPYILYETRHLEPLAKKRQTKRASFTSKNLNIWKSCNPLVTAMKSLCDLCIETLSRNLDMYDCLENLPEFIRTKILSTMKNFFFKRLGKLNNDSVVGYLTILQTQGPVTALNLPWCNRITDDGIHNITQELTSLCNNLTTINLSYCSNVSDGSIQNVCKVCPNIKSIDLTFTAVGDRGIGALVQYSTQSLERLTLEQCSNVTDAGIQILARGFKRGRLTHLNLGGLKKVSNVGIQILASHLKSLRSLSLSGCDCLIDYDIEDICKTLVLLEEFNLRCCWSRFILPLINPNTAANYIDTY